MTNDYQWPANAFATCFHTDSCPDCQKRIARLEKHLNLECYEFEEELIDTNRSLDKLGVAWPLVELMEPLPREIQNQLWDYLKRGLESRIEQRSWDALSAWAKAFKAPPPAPVKMVNRERLSKAIAENARLQARIRELEGKQ